MNGGVMLSQQLRAAAGYGPPAVPFASLPDPSSVPGQVRQISDAGPAPGIELISDGTLWRPRGGRQLLAARGNNPVTVQNAGGAFAETLGPFPGGLVRAGMQLRMAHRASLGIAGSFVARTVELRVDASGGAFGGGQKFTYLGGGTANINTRQRIEGVIDVLSDTSAAHRGLQESQDGYFLNGTNSQLSPTVDFSAEWAIKVYMKSGNETAVNITAASWSAGVVTFTAASHTLAVGDKTTVAGITPSGYNGVYTVLSVPNANTFTAALASDPGAYTSGGTSSRISNVISQSYSLELVG